MSDIHDVEAQVLLTVDFDQIDYKESAAHRLEYEIGEALKDVDGIDPTLVNAHWSEEVTDENIKEVFEERNSNE